MNIGIVTTWFERGAAYVSRHYQQTLEEGGHAVFIFARGEEYARGNPVWDKPNVHWAKTWPLTDASRMQVRDFRRWLIQEQIDLVIFNEQRVLWPIAICQTLGIRTVAYIDYYREPSVKRFSCFDGLICNTQRHYSIFSWHPGAVYIPWGTDTTLFAPTSALTGLVNPGIVTFFHSAGCSNRKGTDLLIKAFAKTSGPGKLIIHTQKNILSWFPDIEPLIQDLERQGRLTIITQTVPAPGLYHLGDVYVYPTKLEGIGLTICEAMSCGLPAIVPDNGPMNEFVEDKSTGLLTPIDLYISRADGYYWPMGIVSIDSLAGQIQFCIDHSDWVLHAKAVTRASIREERDWMRNSRLFPDYIKRLPRHGKAINVPIFLERLVKRYRVMTDM